MKTTKVTPNTTASKTIAEKRTKKERKLEKENSKQKLKISVLQGNTRYLTKRLYDVSNSRDNWKDKYMALTKLFTDTKRKLSTFQNSAKIVRHKYEVAIVEIIINICIIGGCSLRKTVDILNYINIALELGLQDIPCKSSLSNWLKKTGLHLQNASKEKEFPKGYALIVDEFISVGNERMLMILTVAAEKMDNVSLTFDQCNIIYCKVKQSWTALDITNAINETMSEMGEKARYIISDGASTLVKGIRDAGIIRICDVGHEIAKLVEQIYKQNKDLLAFNAAINLCNSKEIMKNTAYLLPPKMRTIARFMNMSKVIFWGIKIVEAWPKLSKEEQDAFGFVKDHLLIINELNVLFKMINPILKIAKMEGWSYATIMKCRKLLWVGVKNCTTENQKTVLHNIDSYLCCEKEKLNNSVVKYQNSSDVLESLFGILKDNMPSNKNNGITTGVLKLSLFLNMQLGSIVVDIKEALEGIFLADIDQWGDDYLIKNQEVKRRKVLKNCT